MDESLLEIIPRMEKRTHYLSALANIGMLIGLLGTVVGLIAAFASIAQANPAEKADLLGAVATLVAAYVVVRLVEAQALRRLHANGG